MLLVRPYAMFSLFKVVFLSNYQATKANQAREDKLTHSYI